jgi:hypothetical protein
VAGYAAIAAAGKTIERVLDAGLKRDVPVPNAVTHAKLVRTEDFKQDGDSLITPPVLSIFLVRADVNHAMRAAWSAVGAVDDRAHLPLDLHYLLSAWARNAEWEHRILGSAMRCLEESAIVSGPQLDASNGADWAPSESLQIVPEEMTTEAVMRTFDSLETSYRLSVPYIARIVRLESKIQPLQPPVVIAVAGAHPEVP